MQEQTSSLVFRLSDARRVFRKTTPRKLVLALLAGLPPEQEWEGCELYQSAAPSDDRGAVRISARGAAAPAVRDRLAAGLERMGIPVEAERDGPQEEVERLARAGQGQWVEW